MNATFSKVGQSAPKGILHAVTTESLSSWEGARSFCGERIGSTQQRMPSFKLRCDGCRAALGMGAEDVERRGLTPRQRFGNWSQM